MKNHLLPLGIILLVAGLLTLVLQEYTHQLVRLLLYIFWIGRLFFESVPQAIIWGVFVAVALLIAGRNLLRQGSSPQPIRRAEPTPQGRIEAWAKLIKQADQETYYKWQLAQPLHDLILAIVAHYERLTPNQVRQRLADNTLELPPELQAYLQASMTSFSHLLPPRSRFRPWSQPSPLDLEPEQIVQFLEDKLDYRPD